ncbi:MAG: hypothetical protein D3910_15145, partial [Candidatus Electrothrix sp. ATG2]|nr:hypothetical protein [Candidatus Electrothrix sp. ATG2]
MYSKRTAHDNIISNQYSWQKRANIQTYKLSLHILFSFPRRILLNPQQLALCRQLLQSIPAALKTRQLAEHHLPAVTWDDVERLLFELAESIEYSSSDATKGQFQKKHKKYYNNIDPLTAVLLSLEETKKTTRH